jgi:hypothetical protein
VAFTGTIVPGVCFELVGGAAEPVGAEVPVSVPVVLVLDGFAFVGVVDAQDVSARLATIVTATAIARAPPRFPMPKTVEDGGPMVTATPVGQSRSR